MLISIVKKIKLYLNEQKHQQELSDLFKIDYRLQKDLMAISKKD